MSRPLLPKYKCEQIAREVSRLLNLAPPLHWSQVREYAEPRLPDFEPDFIYRYQDHKRPLVATALMREIRHQHVWSP